MNNRSPLAFATIMLIALAACADSGKLTNEKAMSALNRWMPNCNATVTGIQEQPQQNLAKVDLNFSNCTFAFSNPNSPTGGGTKNYTGHGEAIFTHYNDGRWVLTKVSAREGWPPFQWDNLNIEVR